MSKNSQEFSRIFSAEYRNLDDVREFVGDAARSCGFPPVDVYHVQAAVDEAFSNIVEHALSNENSREHRVHLQCESYQSSDLAQ